MSHMARLKQDPENRLVIWALHGIYGAGKNLDEAFGLIETVEKTAQIYMLTGGKERMVLSTNTCLCNGKREPVIELF